MVFLAILLFFSNFLIGIIVINYFLSVLPRFAKFSASFFLGTYISTITVFLLTLFFKNSSDPLLIGVIITLLTQIFFIGYYVLKRPNLFVIQLSRFEVVLLAIFFCFGWYIMQKSFGYEDGSFQIASNLYLDFGAHIPIIRSFSMGDNFPPNYPFYAGIPLIYHFFYDFAVAIYEKLGIRIDIANNLLSAMSFAGVLSLIFSLSQEMFAKKKIIGFLAVILFVFNSSLSFVYALEKYFGSGIISKLYNHNVYLGDGPFGNNLVSIFWNLNTYLNQRHLLFTLGIFLIFSHIFYYILTKKMAAFSWIFLAIVVGLLPLWHPGIFISIVCMAIAIFIILWLYKKNCRELFYFIVLSVLIATPQIYLVKQFQTIDFSFFNPGFLIAEKLSFVNFTLYWFWNLGVSIVMIPLGIWLAKGKRMLVIPMLILFLLPNTFQFSPQMFDNHKFFNIFIMLANMYVAYTLYLIFKKQFAWKIFAFILLFALTFSGIIDFLVVKNDVKTQIKDYPNNNFLTWVKDNTTSNAVFLTNAEIYDPITFVGRESFVGRSHYLWAYGINPEERLKVKNEMFSNNGYIELQEIDYVVVYKNISKVNIESNYIKSCKVVYEDATVKVCKALEVK